MAPIESLSVTVSRRRRLGIPGRDAVHTVVRLRGEHDASTVAALSEAMTKAIMLDDNDVVVDMSEVQFMGAATVGVIARARELLRIRSRYLVLRSPSRCARRVLELCDIADLIDPADVMPMTGTAGALGTWVPVPATHRAAPHADESAPGPSNAPDPVSAGRVTATRVSSVVGGGGRDDLTTDVAGRRAP